MGGCHLDPWVQTAIPTPAKNHRPGQNDNHKRPGKSSSTGPGAIRPPGQGCNRGHRSSAATQGLLLNIFPRPQKDRRVPSNSGFEGPQSVHEGAAVPHAHHGRSFKKCCGGRVVYLHRFKGRLLSRTHRAPTPALPQIRLSGSSLAIQGAPIRALTLSEGVHSMCERSPCSNAGLRHEDFAISRRLAYLRTLSSLCKAGHCTPACPRGPVRPQGQFREELLDSFSDYDLHRSFLRLNFNGRSCFLSSCGRHPAVGSPFQTGQSAPICHFPATAGQVDLCHTRHTSGLAAVAPLPEVAEQFPPGRQASQASHGQGDLAVPPCAGSMEGQRFSVQGCPHGFSHISERDCYHRCMPHRVGCCVAAPSSSGALDGEEPFRAHQCSRATCSTPSSKAFSALPEGKTCASKVRQHISSLSHKPPRRDKVSTTFKGNARPFDMGSPSSVLPAGGVSPGREQPAGRFPFSSETSTGGVVPPSGGRTHHLEHLRSGGSRPLRLREHSPMSSMVLLYGNDGLTRPGCTGTSMAPGPPLCVSPLSSDLANSSEGSSGGSQAVVGGPLLASTTMVPVAVQTLPWDSMAPPRQEGPIVPIGGAGLASQSPTPPAVGLATGGPELQLIGFSDPVRQTILNARASSTRQLYNNRWKLFSQWCAGRSEDPVSCSVPIILEFLQSLLDKGRSPSTLKVYVAAISCHHVRVDNNTVGSHNLVSLFLRGARRLRPPTAPRLPAWDLPLVLDALCCPPFEPLAQAELKWLSCKTAFLLAIVSAKRVSELHALSVSASCLKWSPDGSGVTLWPNTAFVPKVLSRSHCNQPLTLARFAPPPGEGGGRSELLCPLRALKAYITATADIRKSDQLFLCYGGARTGSPLSKQRLSHWIVEVIRHAYETRKRSLPSRVKCHSTRGIATSWAAMRGVPLETICAAASWSSPSTFTRFYKVNVATPHPLGLVLLPESSGSTT